MSVITNIVILACFIGGAIALWVIGSLRFTAVVERPKYSVLDKKSGYEIREYEPYIVARTDVFGSFNRSLNGGFGIIANYIFGNNVSRRSEITKESSHARNQQIENEKIPMAAPVISEKATGLEMQGRYMISFVMPSKYTLETLPVPNDARVKISQVRRHVAAAIKFSGYATEKMVFHSRQLLRQMLTRDNIKTKPGYKVAQYDPPFTFPLMKKNEGIIDLQYEDGVPEI